MTTTPRVSSINSLPTPVIINETRTAVSSVNSKEINETVSTQVVVAASNRVPWFAWSGY